MTRDLLVVEAEQLSAVLQFLVAGVIAGALFFVVMAALNEAVWRSTSTDFWIAFKLWFFLPVTFLFMFANVPMLMRHGLAFEESQEEPPVPPTQ